MATYLNDLRLTELATGEGSGTWGTTTNLSLELIGEALGYATQQVFGSDADATTTIADGASDPARAMYFKITSAGSLTATRTCTIAPNTISRVMFIENATTGSQSIQISQGSGASVTILAGKTAVVYLDGAGAGAAVVDAMAGVDPGVTDTLAEVLAAGNTSGANNLIIDNGQAITTNTINETTAASGVTIDSVLLKDDGVNATNLEITNLKANDGTSAGSIADSTGVVTLASSVLTTADINGGTIDGTTLGATTPASVAATTGTFSGDISVAGIGTIKQIDSNSVMIGAGAVNLRMIDVTSDIRPVDSAGLGVDGTVDLGDANARFKDLYLSGAVSSGTITTTGAATFGGTLSSGGITTTGNTAAGTASAGDGRLFPNNAYGAFVYGNGTTYDVALGQRSTGVALGVLAGTTNVVIPTGNVGIGAAAPESIVHIKDSGNVSTTLQIEGAATGYAPVINFDGIVAGNADYLLGEINGSWDTHTNVVSAIRFESGADTTNKDDGLISFWTSSSGPTLTERFRIDASGNLGVGAAATAGVVNANSTRVTIAGTNAASNGGEFIAGGAAAQISMASGTSKSYLWGSGAYPMSFGTNSTERMVLDASGVLSTTATIDDWAVKHDNASATTPYGIRVYYTAAAPNSTGSTFLQCVDSTAERLTIRSNGGIANYQANDANLSDRREKANFSPSKSYLDVICSIPVQTFNYIDQNMEDDSGLTLGVVAQDVQAVAPEFVMESNWGTEEDPKMRLSLYQTDLQYALMKCIQEQQDMITSLTARLEALEGAK